MRSLKILFLQGGWDGHKPEQIVQKFQSTLEQRGCRTEMTTSLERLADTDYTFEERTCAMPVAWTKHWGKGRVFYSALGHDPAEFDHYPQVFQMSLKGIFWAGRAL